MQVDNSPNYPPVEAGPGAAAGAEAPEPSGAFGETQQDAAGRRSLTGHRRALVKIQSLLSGNNQSQRL